MKVIITCIGTVKIKLMNSLLDTSLCYICQNAYRYREAISFMKQLTCVETENYTLITLYS